MRACLMSINTNHITSNKQPVDENHVLDFVELLEAGKTLPPITVRKSASQYILVDGRHRLAAQRLLNKEQVLAYVYQ